jgi:hypothetical protein
MRMRRRRMRRLTRTHSGAAAVRAAALSPARGRRARAARGAAGRARRAAAARRRERRRLRGAAARAAPSAPCAPGARAARAHAARTREKRRRERRAAANATASNTQNTLTKRKRRGAANERAIWRGSGRGSARAAQCTARCVAIYSVNPRRGRVRSAEERARTATHSRKKSSVRSRGRGAHAVTPAGGAASGAPSLEHAEAGGCCSGGGGGASLAGTGLLAPRRNRSRKAASSDGDAGRGDDAGRGGPCRAAAWLHARNACGAVRQHAADKRGHELSTRASFRVGQPGRGRRAAPRAPRATRLQQLRVARQRAAAAVAAERCADGGSLQAASCVELRLCLRGERRRRPRRRRRQLHAGVGHAADLRAQRSASMAPDSGRGTTQKMPKRTPPPPPHLAHARGAAAAAVHAAAARLRAARTCARASAHAAQRRQSSGRCARLYLARALEIAQASRQAPCTRVVQAQGASSASPPALLSSRHILRARERRRVSAACRRPVVCARATRAALGVAPIRAPRRPAAREGPPRGEREPRVHTARGAARGKAGS